MKRVKITNSELRLLLIVAAIAILLLSWFLGYQNMSRYASRVNAQNTVDMATVAQLQAMVLQRSQVEAETAEAYERIDAIIEKYPAELTQEKAIYILQNIEDISGVHVTAVGFLMNDLLSEVSGSSIATGEADASAVVDTPTDDSNIAFYAILTLNYTSTYDGFKNMLAYVPTLVDRATMPNVSAEYDEETGGLRGTITLHMYYLTNTGKEYVAPEITGIDKGVLDIFGTGSNGGFDLTLDERDPVNADAENVEDGENAEEEDMTQDNEEVEVDKNATNNKNNKNNEDDEENE